MQTLLPHKLQTQVNDLRQRDSQWYLRYQRPTRMELTTLAMMMPALQPMWVQERADRGSWEGPLSPWHVLPGEVCLPGGSGFR